ncbi:hypothetical protein AKJ36_02415 [candidate division MSBL1 archaeon SCGC-AAA259I07]|uniref:SHOCT domain-containing protein n=1 Tax=candidate division MSBL1 archaeon SCGC-AAA259I07 TaxID=1698266 RepID=A0A133UKH8_9EURY|nr:hypothetical protein AKJ36_02415 [candidate division MSBL1 archaeon SCGC-AAA259I07]
MKRKKDVTERKVSSWIMLLLALVLVSYTVGGLTSYNQAQVSASRGGSSAKAITESVVVNGRTDASAIVKQDAQYFSRDYNWEDEYNDLQEDVRRQYEGIQREIENQYWIGFWSVFAPFLIFWIVLGFIFCAIVYKDAKKRNANAGLWAVMAFFLGLIGVILWLVARPDKPSDEKKTKRVDAVGDRRGKQEEKDAVAELDERLAEGEISEKTYQEVKERLEKRSKKREKEKPPDEREKEEASEGDDEVWSTWP